MAIQVHCIRYIAILVCNPPLSPFSNWENNSLLSCHWLLISLYIMFISSCDEYWLLSYSMICTCSYKWGSPYSRSALSRYNLDQLSTRSVLVLVPSPYSLSVISEKVQLRSEYLKFWRSHCSFEWFCIIFCMFAKIPGEELKIWWSWRLIEPTDW